MKHLLGPLALAGGIALAGATGAQATIVITGEETGGNVIFSYSGTVNLSGVRFTNSAANYGNLVSPGFNLITAGSVVRFRGPGPITASTPGLGSGGSSPMGTFTGSTFSISSANQFGFTGEIGVPIAALPFNPFANPTADFGVTGLIEGALTLQNTTLLALGLNLPLNFTWTLPSGDTVVLRGVDQVAVGEPGTLALLAGAVGSIAAARRRRAKTV